MALFRPPWPPWSATCSQHHCRRRVALRASPLQHDTGYESDYNRWYHELEGSKLLTSKLARIPEHLIKGSRAPFLACVECPRVWGGVAHEPLRRRWRQHHTAPTRRVMPLRYSSRYFSALHDLGFEYESTLREYGLQSPWRSLISDAPGNKIWWVTFGFHAPRHPAWRSHRCYHSSNVGQLRSRTQTGRTRLTLARLRTARWGRRGLASAAPSTGHTRVRVSG